jgi:uncharacterized damage-inducible protein DinB
MTPTEAKVIADFLLPQIEQEVQTTARVIAAVPDENKDYSPHDTCMKAGTLAQHIALADTWFLESVAAGEFGAYPSDTEMPSSSAEVASQYSDKMLGLAAKVRQMSGEDLARPVTFYHMTMPNVVYLQFLQKHSIHHRGQLTAYLRPMGAKVPSIYGGSADEPFTASASEGK